MSERVFPAFDLENLPQVWFAIQSVADALGYDRIDPARPEMFDGLGIMRLPNGKFSVIFRSLDGEQDGLRPTA